MSSMKAALKAAKQAIDNQDWTEAESQAQTVLSIDKSNYFAKLFLGRSLEKQGKLEQAAKTYHTAAEIKPNDTQAWLGLCSLYEDQGSKQVDEYAECAVRLAQIFGEADDVHRCQSTIDKLVAFVKQRGSTSQYKRALQVTLPGSPVYHFLEGRLPHPAHTFVRLAELTEKEEKQTINKEIGERRTRLGARVAQVTEEVKRQVYAKSDLELLYQSVIDWTLDDEIRATYDDKLLQRVYDTLCVLPIEDKAAKRQEVLDLAQGMVIIKRPCQLAWDIYLEWFETFNNATFDANVLHTYIDLFPSSPLSKTLRAFLGSEISPFPVKSEQTEKKAHKDDDNEQGDNTTLDDNEAGDDVALSQQDRLLLMSESLGGGHGSPLAHRIVGEYYLHLDEYESAIETTRSGLSLLATEESKAGMSFTDSKDALTSTLATSLVHHQAPRNHPEAQRYFIDILQRQPKSTAALIGLGLIHEEQEQYNEAVVLLDQALEQDPTNAQIGTESAWCRALNGDASAALPILENYLPTITSDTPKSRDLRAQTLYRIGRCLWDSDTSKAARKSRTGAYSYFLTAIKTNVNFAHAYTSLGFYYADYARDKKRARQCFQKAFELSSSEVEAAERLARAFAEQSEWDIVESIAQRVIDSGKVRPPPGSKKKGISWPFSALGVVQMTRLDYSKAATSFLSALKIKPDDYNSYVGLGESYHNSGRYNSASRVFNYASDPPDGIEIQAIGETWFTEYMLANVHRELGDYDTAISALQKVLETRPDEFGVLISLLQTLIENSWRSIETGSFGQAIDNANNALKLAEKIVALQPKAFNHWKAVGDACSMFVWALKYKEELDVATTLKLLLSNVPDNKATFELADIDGVSAQTMETEADGVITSDLVAQMAILAYKRAIANSANDIHAQAVAWYNLGWAEYRAYVRSQDLIYPATKRYLKAAVRCFKRSIELEAGNSEFWNSLGVVTSTLEPRVAQHSFVRSLHLNEHSARTWTNLGALYLLNDDYDLAHEAFARAQSTDPEYSHAWLGEGLIAQSLDNAKEAVTQFTHGFEISHASSIMAKQRFAVSMFDDLRVDLATSRGRDLTSLLQPLFALQQLRSQEPDNLAYNQLSALLDERVGNSHMTLERLEKICGALESEYEATEAQDTLVKFAHAKTDLARNQQACGDLNCAIENAQTALDLLADMEPDEPSPGLSMNEIKLSANLTIGLANARAGDLTASIDFFATALEIVPDDSPAIICLLAKVLWLSGNDTDRKVAKDQLNEALERQRSKHPSPETSHGPLDPETLVLAITIALLENDTTKVQKLVKDLEHRLLLSEDPQNTVSKNGYTKRNTLSDSQRTMINDILRSVAAQSSTESSGSPAQTSELACIQTEIMVQPYTLSGWKALASLSGDGHAASMALLTAQREAVNHTSTATSSQVDAQMLAEVYMDTGRSEDLRRGIMLAPWEPRGFELLNGRE